MSELYRIDFPSGKSYIGITNGRAVDRFGQHCDAANRGAENAVHRALRKYGSRATKLHVLYSGDADRELLSLAEQEAVEKFRAKAPHGYNMTDGGDGMSGLVFTEEHRSKISAALTGRAVSAETRARVSASKKGVPGAPHSEEFKRRVAENNKTREWSEESRAKLSESTRARRVGAKWSEETKKKMSESQKAAAPMRLARMAVKHQTRMAEVLGTPFSKWPREA